VQVATVEKRARSETEEVVGTVRARLHATLEAKVGARIEKLPVVMGQTVKSGDLIARLDAPEIRARHDQARAALKQADDDWRRATDLLEKKVSTQSEFDAAESRRRVAQAVLAETGALLSFVEITAPFDGVVARKLAEVGDLAMPGKPLVEIENPSELEVEAGVPESLIGGIKAGAVMRVRVDSLKAVLACKVSEIAAAADANSHTFLVKVSVPATTGLRSGQFARLLVPMGERETIRVPAAAVVRRGQLEIVFVVADERARLRLVRTGAESEGEVEILSGIDAGQTVVIEGAAKLEDGQPVEVK
jgi:RND family efflux transporter MFP subunit